MPHTLNIIEVTPWDEAAVTTLDFATGTTDYQLIEYIPATPTWDVKANEWQRTLEETIRLRIFGTTVDGAINAINAIEEMLTKARERARLGFGNRVLMQYAQYGATTSRYADVHDGSLVIEAEDWDSFAPVKACYIALSLVRDSVCYGAESELPLATRTKAAATGGQTIYNHDDAIHYLFNYDDNAAGNPYTGGSFSANKVTTTPLTLFTQNEAPNEVGDSVYFGDNHAFYGLRFNITTAAVYTSTLLWEYWSGAAWSTLAAAVTENFKATGIRKLTWTAAQTAGWATVAVNGLTMYWIRCRISVHDTWTTSPVVTREYPSSGVVQTDHVNWVEIAAADILGAIPAKTRVQVTFNQNSYILAMGLRQIFDAVYYKGFANESATASTVCSQGGYYRHAFGAAVTWETIAGAGFEAGTSSTDEGRSSRGKSRLWVRTYESRVSTYIRPRTHAGGASGEVVTGDAIFDATLSAWEWRDLGVIDESYPHWPEGYPPATLTLALQGYCAALATNLDIDCYCKLPVDECYVMVCFSNTVPGSTSQCWLDGISPQEHCSILNSSNVVLAPAFYRGAHLPKLRPDKLARLYFLMINSNTFSGLVTDSATVRIYYRPCWLTMAGTT